MKSRSALHPAAARRAFTLIEILTVIAIIAILAALLLATSGYIQEKAGNARAQTEIAALTTALESYKMDMGTYPEGDGEANSTRGLLDALVPKSANDLNPSAKVYLEINPKMLEGYSSKKSFKENREQANALVDPFGNPYRYEFDETDDNQNRSGKGMFNLWSLGKNPQQNAANPEKWIKNW